MSAAQKTQFRQYVVEKPVDEFRHGDCVGADAEAHELITGLCPTIIIHPCHISTMRAWCKAQTVLGIKAPLERNHDIVDAVDILIAAPYTNEEQLRSGTWATIRYARKQGKQVIVLPR